MIGPMTRRAAALLLALVFVTGTLGLPGADALAYHQPGADRGLAQPHFEPAGTSCGHADRCILGATAPAPRLPSPIGVLDRPTAVLVLDGFLPPPADLPGLGRHPLPQPRAPPALDA
jgi:hypothetical protein